MEEGLTAAVESVEDGVDGTGMVTVGGVDHRIGGARFAGKQPCLVEISEHGFDTSRSKGCGVGGGSNEPAHMVSRRQSGGQCPAEESGRAGDEDAHAETSYFRTRGRTVLTSTASRTMSPFATYWA